MVDFNRYLQHRRANRMQFVIHFETLGSLFNAPIVTLVAQGFDPVKCVVLKDKAFYQEVDLTSALKAGTADASMLELWAKRFVKRQPGPGIKPPEKLDLASALMNLSEYVGSPMSSNVWFDTSVVEPATLLWNFKFGSVGLQPRWNRNQVRDLSTLLDAAKVPRSAVKNDSITPQQYAAWVAELICVCLVKLKPLADDTAISKPATTAKPPAPAPKPPVEDDDEL